MNDISKLRGMFSHQDVWVLGNGPSIWKTPLGSIPVERAIGCNRILKTHGCSYVVIVDEMVWDQEQDRLRRNNVHLVVEHGIFIRKVQGNYPKHLAWPFRISETWHPMAPGPIMCNGYLTGYYAADLACRMAAPHGRVILAGMDLRYTNQMKEDQETHASGDERPNGATDMRFPEGRAALRALRARADDSGVEMCVVGPSALIDFDGFPPVEFAVPQ